VFFNKDDHEFFFLLVSFGCVWHVRGCLPEKNNSYARCFQGNPHKLYIVMKKPKFILAFRLVLAHDLLQDRRTTNLKNPINKMFITLI